MKRSLAPLTLSLVLLLPALCLAAGGGDVQMTMEEILWDLGIKFLNVSVLGFFAFKYLSKPLNRLVELRSEKIRLALDEADRAKRDSQERLRAFKEKTAGLEAEIEALRKQTCSDIDKEQKILLEEARRSADHIGEHAKETIRLEVAKAREELHREAVRLASDLAEELVAAKITEEDQRRLLSGYLKEMEAAK